MIPSVPYKRSDLAKFVEPILSGIRTSSQFLWAEEAPRKYSLWTSSIAVRAQIRTVPIMYKPDNDDDEEPVLSEKKGLQLYSPWYVSEANCAENKGFLEIVTQLYIQSLPKLVEKQYTFVRMDVSLFMAWIRVPCSFFILTLF